MSTGETSPPTPRGVGTGSAQVEFLDVLIRGLETMKNQLTATDANEPDTLAGPVCLLIYWGIESETATVTKP